MKVIKSLVEWQQIRRDNITGTLGFIPTMGALHEGHISLIQKSTVENDSTVVCIFVNPTQFNNAEDLKTYPRTLEADSRMIERAGVQYLLTPTFEDLYPDNYRYKVAETQESHLLCGAHRPGHFDGVLTVVTKLFNLVRPDKAYFGEKDFQQLQLIEEMVASFFMNVKIVRCSTVREKDGLAMSSRNSRLSRSDREKAPRIYQNLISSSSAKEAREKLHNDGFGVDYVEDLWGRRLAAVHLGSVRLIDNVALSETRKPVEKIRGTMEKSPI